jgi:probable rRNA maturation factor
MVFIDNQTELKIAKKRLKKIKKFLTDKDLELVICDNDYIKDLNFRFRGVDTPTDVLSFPLVDEVGLKTLGTIVISENFVREGAEKYNHKKRDELALLFIHGLLHLLGEDHEIDDGKMRELEEKVISHFELPKSLIVRTEDIS